MSLFPAYFSVLQDSEVFDSCGLVVRLLCVECFQLNKKPVSLRQCISSCRGAENGGNHCGCEILRRHWFFSCSLLAGITSESLRLPSRFCVLPANALAARRTDAHSHTSRTSQLGLT